jgi:hypothetical protein
MPRQTPAEHFKHEVQSRGIVRTVNHRERAHPQRCRDLSGIIAMRPRPLHHHDRRRLDESGQQFKKPWAPLAELI